MRKLFGEKSITHLIYGFLMLMPFVAIGVKSLYVVCNKNAYESYSNYNADNTKYENVNSFNDFVDGRSYLFLSDNNTTNLQTSMANSLILNVSNVSVTSTNVGASTIELIEQANIIRLWRDSGNNWIRLYNNATSLTSSSFASLNLNFTFTLVNYSNQNTQLDFNSYNGNMIYKSELINTTNTLDNVFTYSIHQIVDNNNIGVIDFTSWFRGLALSDNATNNLFINFVNWYFNYAIVISAVNILFLCLLWFVNFARRLLERFMNYDW